MQIVHITLTSVFDTSYAYQDNLLPKYHLLAGHQVAIITTPYRKYDTATGSVVFSGSACEHTPEGIPVYRLKALLPYRINTRVYLFKGLHAALEREAPDLIFTHGLHAFSYLQLLSYRRKHPRVKIVFDNHGDMFNSCRNILSLFYTKYILRTLLSRRLSRIGCRFYGVTPARCDFLHDIDGIPKEKIDLLLMGADDERMEWEKRPYWRKSIRAEYGISDEDFLVVSGGRIDARKRLHLLAEAVNTSAEKRLKLLLFGSVSDEIRECIEAQLSERVKIAGWVPSDEVYRYFHAADLIVFPGLHSVLWEQALACKLPCAFSRLKGFEHVEVSGTLLLDETTVPAYRKCIEGLCGNPAAYEKLKKAADSADRECFLYSRIAQKVIDDIH